MIYVDYNATTPIGSRAKDRMDKAIEIWGNPSSGHRLGRKAQELVHESRVQIAEINNILESELVFTSGGSEANTSALLGSALRHGSGFRLLTSPIEHSSLRDSLVLIEKLGGLINYAPIFPSGELDLVAFEKLLTEFKPHMVSLMVANNETGVIFPIPEVSQLCKKFGVILHTDAVQAFGKMNPTYWKDADLVSISAHKISGPKGIGALIVRGQNKLVSTHYGGAQEIKRRGGTENVIGIAGFGGACAELSDSHELERIQDLRNDFEGLLKNKLEGVSLQGVEHCRIPNTSNISFHGIPSEVLLGLLDLEGIYVSAGSACSSGSVNPSHVLLAMGLKKEEAKECLRFSWGKLSTEEEMQTVTNSIIGHVNCIRERRQAHANN